MNSPIPTLVSWSSGKDSAWAVQRLAQDERYQICGLLTTINSAFDRVAMHSTRREVLEAQAAALGLPLWIIPLPWPCSNPEYEAAMQKACDQAIASGVRAIAFGDLFLEDIRKYREDSLRKSGLTPLFPIWGTDTRLLLPEMIASGLKARIVCVDPNKMPREFAGRDLDDVFCVNSLPRSIRVGKTASFIPASTMVRRFVKPCQSKAARWLSATASSMPTCSLEKHKCGTAVDAPGSACASGRAALQRRVTCLLLKLSRLPPAAHLSSAKGRLGPKPTLGRRPEGPLYRSRHLLWLAASHVTLICDKLAWPLSLSFVN